MCRRELPVRQQAPGRRKTIRSSTGRNAARPGTSDHGWVGDRIGGTRQLSSDREHRERFHGHRPYRLERFATVGYEPGDHERSTSLN